jgi:uncharacterized phage infection (PIP) family protein YhgE
MEPLSITTGVLSLLSVCLTVSVELKKLRDGSAEAKTKINALLADVQGLRHVLQSMESTFQELEDREGFQTTGHIGAHWKNLIQSLQDGHKTLTELEELLKTVNKNVSILDAPRRHFRLRSATEQIADYRQQVQTYRDAMQFSLQIIILYDIRPSKTPIPGYWLTNSTAGTLYQS